MNYDFPSFYVKYDYSSSILHVQDWEDEDP